MDNRRLAVTVLTVVENYRERGFFPSVVVRVFSAESTLCQITAGGAKENTLFDVASLTKIATATQVLQAIHQGPEHLRLTDRVLEIMPELAAYPVLEKRLADVTIRALLTHTSGIVDWYPFYTEAGDFARALAVVLERCGPVKGVVYSDLNFMLLGKILEAVTKMSLEDCLRKNLTGPGGLLELSGEDKMLYRPDSAWDIAPSSYGNPIEEKMCAERGIFLSKLPNCSNLSRFSGGRPHEPVRGQVNDCNAHYCFGGVAGSAGIFATVGAYEKLCQFYMNTDIPLFVESQEECEPGRGLGWQVGGEVYPEGCGHGGFTGTSVYLSRRRNVGVVAFTNRLFFPEENPNDMDDFRRALHRAVIECV